MSMLFAKVAAAAMMDASERFNRSHHRSTSPPPARWTGQPIVSLRRYGDIIALLPLLKRLSREHPIRLVVHRAFANVLDGVSYVAPIIWDGDMDDPLSAARQHGAVNAQVHGKNVRVSKGDNFIKKSWAQLGVQWNRHWPLVFDKRQQSPEKYKTPPVLIKLTGFSSAFTDSEALRLLIKSQFDAVIDLDLMTCSHVYDLLNCMDSAACLVSIDTVTLHLARASKCPIIALVNDQPHLASPPSGNVILRMPYGMALKEAQTILNAIKVCLSPSDNERIALVYQDFFPTKSKDQRRYVNASSTWHKLGADRVIAFKGLRTSRSVGSHRDTPFISDMLNAAFDGEQDIAVITNNDISFGDGLRASILESCQKYGCYWAYRKDADTGATDLGADLFALTRKWWNQHRHLWPDLLIGEPWWDDALLRIMRWSGCLEQAREYFHESHAGVMQSVHSEGWKYNERVTLEWLKQHHEQMGKPE